MSNKTKTNPTKGLNPELNGKNPKYYEIKVWVDEVHRNQGVPLIIQPHLKKVFLDSQIESLFEVEPMKITFRDEWSFESLEEIKSYVIEIYRSEIMIKSGSIEINSISQDGDWVKTLYHISEGSNHELKQVI